MSLTESNQYLWYLNMHRTVYIVIREFPSGATANVCASDDRETALEKLEQYRKENESYEHKSDFYLDEVTFY